MTQTEKKIVLKQEVKIINTNDILLYFMSFEMLAIIFKNIICF